MGKEAELSNTGYHPIQWLGDRVKILDQTQLPQKEVYLELDDYHTVAAAIKELKIRGAPAIGIAGAYGVALGALKIDDTNVFDFLKHLNDVFDVIAATRPTARNLFFALERMKKATENGDTVLDIKKSLVAAAQEIHEEEADATHHLSLFYICDPVSMRDQYFRWDATHINASPSYIPLVDEGDFEFAGLCLECNAQSRAGAYDDYIVFFHKIPSMAAYASSSIVNE